MLGAVHLLLTPIQSADQNLLDGWTAEVGRAGQVPIGLDSHNADWLGPKFSSFWGLLVGALCTRGKQCALRAQNKLLW